MYHELFIIKVKQINLLNVNKTTNLIITKPLVIENIENEGQKSTLQVSNTIERKSLKTIQLNNDIPVASQEQEQIIEIKSKKKQQAEPKIKETFRKPSVKKSKHFLKLKTF